MDIGEQDRHFAASCEELGDFQHRHEVAAVRLAGRCSSPVDFKGAFIFVQDLFDDLGVQHFLQVAGDELQFFRGGLRLGCCHGCGWKPRGRVCCFSLF